MDHYKQFRFSLIGLELPKKVDKSQIIFDFYNGEKHLKSYYMREGKVNYDLEYSPDLQYIKVVTRTVNEGEIIGTILLTLSFIAEWDLEGKNEQWLPLSNEGNSDFYAQDFNAYKMNPPCLMIRFQRIYTPPPSPEEVVHDDLSIEKDYVREPYGYDDQPMQEPDDYDYDEPEPVEDEPEEYFQEPQDYAPESQDYVPASQEYVQEPQESIPVVESEPEETKQPDFDIQKPIIPYEPEEVIQEPVIVREPEPVKKSPRRVEKPIVEEKKETPPRPPPKKASLRRKDVNSNLPLQVAHQRAVIKKEYNTRSELSRYDKVFLSDAYVYSSNYYIPEDRDHLRRKLDNLVEDVQEKHEEILQENEE